LKRVPSGFAILLSWIICTYYSNLLPAVHLTLLGNFSEATELIDAQWALFMPSLFGFALYEAYSLAVEYNKTYKTEQSEYLEKEYQQLRLSIQNRR
ncbi:hypothetical protein, partial [Pseudomonas sp. 2822-17]|uniref:hypothetical protein n=1 Tax=Pseudomonas sp. 2822-17 TaxID=1712678 RepID=UPI001C47A624